MAKNKGNPCKGKTKSGAPCKKIAGKSGYCDQHDPEKTKEKDKKIKELEEKENRLYELINMVLRVSQAKGWEVFLKSVDKDNWRYATISASRMEGHREVSASVEISCDSKVSISTEPTSFHRHGITGLRKAIGDEFEAIPWLKLIDENPKDDKKPDFIEALYRLLRRFDIIVRQLKRRHADRESFEVKDEYDVQDILHALLRGLFEDVRSEEVAPSYGGASSRLDFLLKNEKLVIETKMASVSLRDKQIGEQLIIDIERYQAHPDCKTLICFVYDPDSHIKNPAGLENDLRRKVDNFEVIVIVVPH